MSSPSLRKWMAKRGLRRMFPKTAAQHRPLSYNSQVGIRDNNRRNTFVLFRPLCKTKTMETTARATSGEVPKLQLLGAIAVDKWLVRVRAQHELRWAVQQKLGCEAGAGMWANKLLNAATFALRMSDMQRLLSYVVAFGVAFDAVARVTRRILLLHYECVVSSFFLMVLLRYVWTNVQYHYHFGAFQAFEILLRCFIFLSKLL